MKEKGKIIQFDFTKGKEVKEEVFLESLPNQVNKIVPLNFQESGESEVKSPQGQKLMEVKKFLGSIVDVKKGFTYKTHYPELIKNDKTTLAKMLMNVALDPEKAEYLSALHDAILFVFRKK